ncbi:hypothetical protein NW752_005155 [Fusarium irregulare]|uniref:PH domain-containing protein n=1 Tax=Fusarium irregulare TaxID=2494466 RepID=A0A9W8U8J9_9HYPO|nr:hypothetical protein NW766_008351 [Fusarium irregulare]KAJ4020052.1 hypothetical protein NW752_005155 [Fusarium irregulare]
MDLRRVTAEDDGSSTITPNSPPLRRRVSMEEDLHYQRVMTNQPRPSQPPPYQQERDPPSTSNISQHGDLLGKGKELTTGGGGETQLHPDTGKEKLPDYKNSICLEGVFDKKHEIENLIKRAEDRQWYPVYVCLNGTALNIYGTKKAWKWGRTRDDGPSVNPDNPPWVKKGKLEKTYSLLYADVGIAADYKKRRYTIRVRAETDQFLLCCVELSTFNKWLEGMFAAIDIALPLEDRDFPRDMSIPRIQRIRWFHGQSPTATAIDLSELGIEGGSEEISATTSESRSSAPPLPLAPESQTRLEPEIQVEGDEEEVTEPPPRIDLARRLSTTSYNNMGIDPVDGKWIPEHQWSTAHDLLYAKLCYSNLLFRSPRKTPYIINKGKKFYVDWTTGRMVRVLPPAYGEIDYFGAWQTVHTENRLI